jgi:hypothetical protein
MQEFLARLWRGLVAHVDTPLLLITLMLMAAGLTTVYSATYDANSHLLPQLLNMAIGLVRNVGGGAAAASEADAFRCAAVSGRCRSPDSGVLFRDQGQWRTALVVAGLSPASSRRNC